MRTHSRVRQLLVVTALGTVTALTVAPTSAAGGLVTAPMEAERLRDLASATSKLGSIPDETVVAFGFDVSLAELVDSHLIAEAQGISLEEAINRYAWQSEFNDVAGHIETGEIGVEALPGAVTSRARVDLHAQLRPAQPANDAITIQVRLVDRLAASADGHLFGGGLITGCTAGFAVIHTSGVTGLATADHCAVNRPSVTYTNHNGGGSHTLTRRDRSGTGSHGDLAWYRGSNSHVASEWFYHDWNSIRQVTAVGTALVGNTACNFGRATGGGGDKCRIVASRNRCEGGYCGLTVMSGYINANTDSGGPWFFGGTAYGIHHGRLGGSAFTPVRGNLFQSMSVVVIQT